MHFKIRFVFNYVEHFFLSDENVLKTVRKTSPLTNFIRRYNNTQKVASEPLNRKKSLSFDLTSEQPKEIQ